MGSWVWIAIVVTALAGILGVALILAKRPVDVDDLGRVTRPLDCAESRPLPLMRMGRLVMKVVRTGSSQPPTTEYPFRTWEPSVAPGDIPQAVPVRRAKLGWADEVRDRRAQIVYAAGFC